MARSGVGAAEKAEVQVELPERTLPVTTSSEVAEQGPPPSRSSGLGGVLALNAFFLSPVLLYNCDLRAAGRVDAVSAWLLLTSALWLATFQLLARRPVYFFAAAVPLGVTVTADLFLVVVFDSRLTTSYLSVILDNLADVGDFAGAFLPQLLLATGGFVTLYGGGLWLVRHVTFPPRRRWALAPLALVVALYGAVTGRQLVRSGDGLSRTVLDVVTHDTNSPFGVLGQAFITYQLHQETLEKFAATRGFRFEAVRDPAPVATPDAPEVHVLVIGETSRPDRWALNGYSRPTSPRLSAQENLLSFKDVITQSPSTSDAVPLMLTRATADDFSRLGTERSIITAFKEVGFRTFWMSTQEVSHWSGFIHHYAGEADVRRYFERRHDEVMLAPFEEVLASVRGPDDKAFVVLHPMGSHFTYENRYPPEFRTFDVSPGLSWRDRLWNSYDNTIVYTDHVLAELIERLEARPDVVSTLTFVSDHGENLLDDERELFGHPFGTRYDLPVATFFWYSPAFARQNPEAVKSARANLEAPLSTAVVFHSLADMARIRAAGFEQERSVFSPKLRPPKRLFTARGKVADYDALEEHTKYGGGAGR